MSKYYYPQAHLGECKYKEKEINKTRYITEDIVISSCFSFLMMMMMKKKKFWVIEE